MLEELKSMVGPDEKILYEGKPDKKCYIFEGIFNPLLPFALIWIFADFCIFTGIFVNTNFEIFKGFLPFLLFHLMPVWMYLSGVLFIIKRYTNTRYIVTDKAIYISSGAFSRNINTKPFTELSRIDLHRGIFDQWFDVGDIIATTNKPTHEGGTTSSIVIASISNYKEVYNIVKKLQTDIYTDVMYPNAKRPSENPGYNTEYKGL